jgi:hypothetical protein
MKSLKNLFLAGLAVLAIVSAACKNDPPPYTPPGIDEFLSGFADLDVGEATGQTPPFEVKGEIKWGDDVGNVTINGSSTEDGYEITVANGKVTLNLKEPTRLANETDNPDNRFGVVKEYLLGTKETPAPGTFDPDTAKFCLATFEGTDTNGDRYFVERSMGQTDEEETYFVGSVIFYVYVDTNCNIKKAAEDFQRTDDEGESWIERYGAIDLSLKKGWNLVQINESWTGDEPKIFTFKIADKDIPWSIWVY